MVFPDGHNSPIPKTDNISVPRKMELTFVTDLGHTFVVEIDPNMELGTVMVLLEAEVRLFFTISTAVPRVFFFFSDLLRFLIR